MNLSFRPRIFRTLLLVTFVALGLSACAEQENADVSADSTDAAAPAIPGQQGRAPADSVTVQSTIGLLRGGVQRVAINRAVQNINGWQQQLDGTEWADLSDQLGTLKQDLVASDQIDGAAIGQQLTTLGNRTSEAANSASGPAATQLTQLAQLLTETGQQLSEGTP